MLFKGIRIKRWIATALIVFAASFASKDLKAELSPQTLETIEQGRTELKNLKDKPGLDWTKQEMQKTGQSFADIVKGIAQDIIRELKAKKYTDILEMYDQMRRFQKLAQDFHCWDSYGVAVAVTNRIKKEAAELEAEEITREKIRKYLQANPEGIYVYELDGIKSTFKFKSSAKLEEGGGVRLASAFSGTGWRGRRPTRAEWEVLSQGKPKELNRYLQQLFLKQILKKQKDMDEWVKEQASR